MNSGIILHPGTQKKKLDLKKKESRIWKKNASFQSGWSYTRSDVRNAISHSKDP